MSYPLTELLQAARETSPEGISYGVKKAGFPDLYKTEPDNHMWAVLINATPEEYHIASSGQEAASFNIVVSEWDTADVRRYYTAKGGWRVEAVRFGGQLILPHLTDGLREVGVVGAFVPGETATGFVHLPDGEDAVHMDRAFEVAPTRCESPVR